MSRVPGRIPSDDPYLQNEKKVRVSRRNWTVLFLVVFVGLIIFTNLPHKATLANNQSDMVGLTTEIRNDMLGCNTAIRDAFDALQAIETGTEGNIKTANAILQQDLSECTVINADLLDLLSTPAPTELSKLGMQNAMLDYYNWAYPNADAVIQYISELAKNPHDPALIGDIKARFIKMQRNLNEANALTTSVSNTLKMKPATLKLFSLADVPKGVL